MQGRDKSVGRAAKQRNGGGGHNGEVPKSKQRYEKNEFSNKRVSFDALQKAKAAKGAPSPSPPPKPNNGQKSQLNVEMVAKTGPSNK